MRVFPRAHAAHICTSCVQSKATPYIFCFCLHELTSRLAWPGWPAIKGTRTGDVLSRCRSLYKRFSGGSFRAQGWEKREEDLLRMPRCVIVPSATTEVRTSFYSSAPALSDARGRGRQGPFRWYLVCRGRCMVWHAQLGVWTESSGTRASRADMLWRPTWLPVVCESGTLERRTLGLAVCKSARSSHAMRSCDSRCARPHRALARHAQGSPCARLRRALARRALRREQDRVNLSCDALLVQCARPR